MLQSKLISQTSLQALPTLISLNKLDLDSLFDKPSAACCPTFVPRRHKVKPPHQLRQKFCHFKERYVLPYASSCPSPKLYTKLGRVLCDLESDLDLLQGNSVPKMQLPPLEPASAPVETGPHLCPRCSHRCESPRR
jgi:hypothetical protein